MNKFRKNKILLFYIFSFNSTIIFAQSQVQENLKKDNETIIPQKNNDIASLEKENTLLELEMKKKFLTLELKKKELENKDFDKKNKEIEDFEVIDLEIKKINKEIELLQNKNNLFIAKQFDNEEAREKAKKRLEINNKKKDLEDEIELLKKEQELKIIKHAQSQVVEENKIEYLDNPLLQNGTLVISDRQIKMDSCITHQTADKIENDIDFFNNKNDKQPIFLVIDRCQGGSADAGARILDKIINSQAPVFVVVKSFAASMAAIITALAPRSFCLKNAIILHHQPSRCYFFTHMNVREQEEAFKELKEVWKRLE